jgi:hypothetical protein
MDERLMLGTPTRADAVHGLFGFVGEAPRLTALAALLKGAATGGPLGWSIAREELTAIPSLQVHHFVKEFDAAVELVGTCSCFIGIAGPTPDGPLVTGLTALAHTRLVEASAHHLERATTTNDSEVLLQFVVASHGDLAVRVLAAMQQLPHGNHGLLVMQPNVIVSAGQSMPAALADDREGNELATSHRLGDAHVLFYTQREEGTYFCSRRVLSEMHPVRGVTAFRLTRGDAPD